MLALSDGSAEDFAICFEMKELSPSMGEEESASCDIGVAIVGHRGSVIIRKAGGSLPCSVYRYLSVEECKDF